ncbi:unnamed protein product [Cylicocyclus nassatus]|uniref:Uncharacterized protein n=1 Tax=Cylicocyclus nassatus TaxID=53992 RepID=A0AA36H313_CYLNA|nr:unnamed protein product [Cylicocyclus nassatus]
MLSRMTSFMIMRFCIWCKHFRLSIASRPRLVMGCCIDSLDVNYIAPCMLALMWLTKMPENRNRRCNRLFSSLPVLEQCRLLFEALRMSLEACCVLKYASKCPLT